jgi:hypothetical protein
MLKEEIAIGALVDKQQQSSEMLKEEIARPQGATMLAPITSARVTRYRMTTTGGA